MKKSIPFLMVIGVITAMTLCACSKQTTDSTAPAATAVQEATLAATEAPAAEITAPETAAEEAEEKEDISPQGADNSSADADALTGKWELVSVTADGQEQKPAVFYGSVIRQTGAYIELNDDMTFNCVLGMLGCQGDYTVDGDKLTLHITTDYDGTSDAGKACDERTAVTLDRENNTLTFDYHNATNTFKK